MKIGHRAMNLGLAMMDAIDVAAEIGYDGVSVVAREGWVEPEDFSEEQAREIREACDTRGLTISALTGRLGSMIDEGADERLERALLVMEAANRLQTPFVTSHIGIIPEDLGRDDVAAMLERMDALCSRADELGVTIGVETGPESAEVLRGFIERLGSERLRVNYDPANMLMKGFDHMGGVEVLAPYIVHTHAKDAVREDPDGSRQRPLGEGDVDIRAWIAELRRVGFDGWVCVERESGDDRLGDARKALELLRRLV
ncbi:MAG: TIM barrel protein [Armatimonadia bacterium]|nr:TIM barrel protein [Armatimonadia bacterium]